MLFCWTELEKLVIISEFLRLLFFLGGGRAFPFWMFNFTLSHECILLLHLYTMFTRHAYDGTFILKEKILLCPFFLKIHHISSFILRYFFYFVINGFCVRSEWFHVQHWLLINTTSCSSLYSAANGSLGRVLETKLTVRGHNVTNKITDTKVTGEQSAVTSYCTTYTHTHVGILNST